MLVFTIIILARRLIAAIVKEVRVTFWLLPFWIVSFVPHMCCYAFQYEIAQVMSLYLMQGFKVKNYRYMCFFSLTSLILFGCEYKSKGNVVLM